MRAVGCELVMEERRGGGRLPLEKALSLGRPVILGSFRGEGGPQRVVGVEAYSSPEMFFWRWLSISPIPHPHPSPISIPIPTRWYGAPGPFLLRIDRSGFNLSWHVFPRRVPSLHQQQHQSPSPSTVDAMVTLTPNRRGHGRHGVLMLSAALLLCCVLFAQPAAASAGDRLPEFKECIKVCPLLPPRPSVSTADVAPLDLRARELRPRRRTPNPDPYVPSLPSHPTPTSLTPPLALHRRLLLWSCPSECDYTCQHIITDLRLSADPPPTKPVVQFHGKWPFTRFLGVQEPASVLFSAGNLWAHYTGLRKLREQIPASYPLRKFYLGFAYVSMAAWMFSVIFHTRDFPVTEQLDYFGAGAAVLYGLYNTVVRMFRLEKRTPGARRALRAWSGLCVGLFVMHVAYLKLWAWDYTYNMAANVAVGALQNAMWSWYSVGRYRKSGRGWMAWPGVAVAWIMGAMSLELLDFAPLWGVLDAHSLWHMLTVAPATLWYK